ncbi:O-antigen ligase family protein [Solwaraspora sp. WMMD791]|uniref:O-antigen ligase family protein n=1 Tax=Solwaraspora sp. WMMD791 TaxID=3016086 RepID=UPI00249B18D1|nr:O-antigen ligase family protein [Solwaraspora sp. WMMD791]WFE28156.1 O-antigen ligase family protein [Solwaraspora sp. WMMD791]
MVDRVSQLASLVGAACLVVVTIILAMHDLLIACAVAALLLLVGCACRMDGWRAMLALTMGLLVAASSDVQALVDASFYPRYAAVGMLVVWLLCVRRPPSSRFTPWTGTFVGALWLVAGLATVSATWSIVALETFQRGVALLLLAALVHLLIRRRWPDRTVMLADLRVIYLVLSLSAVVSLGYGLTDATLAAALSGSQRFQGLYNNPNMLGMVCALTIPLGWAVYRQTRRPIEMLGMVPAAGALVLSQSRTALVAVAVGALWVVLRHGIGPVARLVTAAAAGLLTAYLFNLLPAVAAAPWMQQIVARFTAQEDLSNGRVAMWQATVDLWWQNRPALGFGYASRDHLTQLTSYERFLGLDIGVVHNSYLQLLLELGLVAVVPLLMLLLAVFRAAVRAPVTRINSGLIWLIVTGLLIQITESAMFGTGQTYPYVFWLAVAAVLLHLPTDRRTGDATGQPTPRRRPADVRVGAGPVGHRPRPARSGGDAPDGPSRRRLPALR